MQNLSCTCDQSNNFDTFCESASLTFLICGHSMAVRSDVSTVERHQNDIASSHCKYYDE